MKRIVVIGAGGIGTHLLLPLCRYLDNISEKVDVVILDGDQYEVKNATRQNFVKLGNKAQSSRDLLLEQFPDLEIQAKPVFLSEENIFAYIEEGDIVFACVDNHATRLLLSDYCATLSNVVLISGGNEFSDGNIQVYHRRKGADKTPPLTFLHPEIAKPTDRNPNEMSCEELSQAGSPQLIFANLTAASMMLNAFWVATQQSTLPYTEVYFDLKTGASRPVNRKEVP